MQKHVYIHIYYMYIHKITIIINQSESINQSVYQSINQSINQSEGRKQGRKETKISVAATEWLFHPLFLGQIGIWEC